MQRTLAIVTALMVSAPLVGCGKNSKHGNQPGQAGPLTIQLTSSKDGVAKEETRAGYGFSVDELGTYRVGPGPAGEVVEGHVTPSELATLLAAAGNLGNASVSESTSAPDSEIDSNDHVAIIKGSSAHTVISSNSTEYRFQTATRDQAEALHHAIRDLAARYYPESFPSDCATKINSLIALEAPLRECSADADCGYTHWDFSPAEGTQLVATDLNRYFSPIVVGNTAKIAAAKDQLVGAWNAADEACALRNANRKSISVSADTPAICEAHVCKVNPAISY